MFKGRELMSGTDSGNFTGVLLFEANTLLANNVGDYPLHSGLTITITLTHETVGYDTNYFIYVADESLTPIRNIGNSTTPSITHTIIDSNAACIVISGYDSPSGSYDISWSITMVDAMINNPIELIREMKIRQNWSELDVSYNWGVDTVPEALIKISGVGSFNDPSLLPIMNIEIAGQIDAYNDGWTNDIVQQMCERFFLLSYQDESGYECLKYIYDKENPSTTITLDHIKSIGNFIEPASQNIFCAPVINYAFDYATDKFTQKLTVDNPWAATYSASYVSGFSGSDGETVWGLCKALYQKTRQVEPMPTNLSDCHWVKTYAGALWCLQTMLYGMTVRSVEMTVGFETGYTWRPGKHFKIQLPHHTDDIVVECVVLSDIEIDKDNNAVICTVAILDDIDTEIFLS